MNVKSKILLLGIIILFTFFYARSTNAYSAAKDSLKFSPAFYNVDVSIKCEWGVNERFDKVDVVDSTKSIAPHLVILEGEHIRAEIRIIKGVEVLIYNHDTGILLKTYTSHK
jgi:hypothetical protein